jgi:hypothetical protein
MEQEVFGRVATNTQFREYNQLCIEVISSTVRIFDDLLCVSGDITDRQINLRQCDLDCVVHSPPRSA